MDERSYWLGFSVFPGIGPLKFQKLLKTFGNAKDAWEASVPDLIKTRIGNVIVNKFDRFRNEFSIKLYQSKLREKRISFVLTADKEYPKLLAQIKNPPFVLYVKGEGALLGNKNFLVHDARGPVARSSKGAPSSLSFGTERRCAPLDASARATPRILAVVGTRRITNYGTEVTEMFVRELVDADFTIVSGLALGVDAAAHKAALENGGKTIAVLGCGVDCCIPRENQALYNSIVKEGGCVVSELPLGHPPTIGSFPSRNRIIAGLSLGVLVTEGAEDSGSLITADYAFKFNRKVFAVPGPITSSLSKGPYKLIQKGAKLVTNTEDIIKELGITGTTGITGKKSIRGETKEEQKILEVLQNEAVHFDEIVKRTKINPSKLGSIISVMEVKGIIQSIDGSTFSIIRET